jgi:hypothetical protein
MSSPEHRLQARAWRASRRRPRQPDDLRDAKCVVILDDVLDEPSAS